MEFPGTGSYAVAVFTQAAAGEERTINAVIGRAAAAAIEELSADGRTG